MTLTAARDRGSADCRPRAATPARPGPGPTPEALLRALDLSIGRRIRGLVPGEYRAHDLGGGTELAQVRPYEPGDDVRRIDWNVTARMTMPARPGPRARARADDLAPPRRLAVDAFGTADRRKADVAEGVAIAIGHLSTQRGNRLGRHDVRRPQATGGPAVGPGAPALLARSSTPRPTARVSAEDQPLPVEPRRRGGAAVRRPRRAARAASSSSSPTSAGPLDWLPQLARRRPAPRVLVVEIRDPREDDAARRRRAHARRRRDRARGPGRHLVARASAPGSPRPPSATATTSRTELRRLRVRHVVLSTSGSWLRSLADQLRLQGMLP